MPKIQLTTIAGKQVIDPDEPQLSHEIFQVPWHGNALFHVV